MENHDLICKNNKMVNCANHSECSHCGWDNHTKALRVQEFLRQQAVLARLIRCPFCGRAPRVIRADAGVSIRCQNPNCVRPGTGVCIDMDTAAGIWNHRHIAHLSANRGNKANE